MKLLPLKIVLKSQREEFLSCFVSFMSIDLYNVDIASVFKCVNPSTDIEGNYLYTYLQNCAFWQINVM